MTFDKIKEKWALERKDRLNRSETLKRLVIEKGTPIFEKYGICKVILFGSVADGSCEETSDVDVLVISLSNDYYWDFRRELEDAVGVRLDVYTDMDESKFVKKIVFRGETLYEV